MKRLALSDSSSSEDKVLVVGLQRYEVLELNRVLANKAQCASRGVHAMHELTVLFKAVYATRASKAVQQAMFNDALVALTVADRSLAYKTAAAELLKAADKVLPQQKRQQLRSEHRKTALSAARQKDCCGDDSDEEAAAQLDSLPKEILQEVLHDLDPASLASMACCSRKWNALASSNEIWQQWCHKVFKLPCSAALGTGSERPAKEWHRAFRENIQASAPARAQWTSHRVLIDGQPTWQPQQVLAWLLGRVASASDSDDLSSDSDVDHSQCAGSSSRQLKLWSLPQRC